MYVQLYSKVTKAPQSMYPTEHKYETNHVKRYLLLIYCFLMQFLLIFLKHFCLCSDITKCQVHGNTNCSDMVLPFVRDPGNQTTQNMKVKI